MRLIERIPELEALRHHPWFRKAIEKDNPHAIYRAIVSARLLRRAPEHRVLLDTLVARRRLFLKPIQRAPVLFTYNGVGFTVYGRREPSLEDGSFITTHFLTCVFVPIYPLCQYLAFSGDTQNSYRFVGKVPFSLPLYLWNRMWAFGIFLAMLVAGANAWHDYGHKEVWIANPLDRTIRVHLAGVETKVQPGSMGHVTVPVGKHPIMITTEQNEPVESGPFDVRAGRKVDVWNVLGLSPVTYREIVYVADDARKESVSPPAPPITKCHDSQLEFDRPDYVFTEPPKRVNMDKHTQSVRHHVLEVNAAGFAYCAGNTALLSKEQGRVLSQRLRTLVRLTRPRDETLRIAFESTRHFDGQGPSERFARELHERMPEDIEVHRLYQDAFRFGPERANIVDEYRRLYDAKASSVDVAYLLSRVLPEAESEQLLKPLFDRFPTHRYLPRSLGYSALNLGHYPLASVAFEAWLNGGSREGIEELITSYVGEARFSTAAELLERQFSKLPAETATRDRVSLAILDARLSRIKAAEHPARLVDRVAEGVEGLREYVLTSAGVSQRLDGLDAISKEWRAAMQLRLAIQQGPEQTIGALEAAPPPILAQLPTEDLILAYGEAKRRKHAELVERLKRVDGSEILTTPLDRWLEQGEQIGDVARGSLTMRAAAEFARARMDGLDGTERERLLQAAKEHDLLPSDVTFARERWTL